MGAILEGYPKTKKQFMVRWALKSCVCCLGNNLTAPKNHSRTSRGQWTVYLLDIYSQKGSSLIRGW